MSRAVAYSSRQRRLEQQPSFGFASAQLAQVEHRRTPALVLSLPQLRSDVPCDLVALRRSRSSRTPSKMYKDCVPNLAFNRFTSTFLYRSYDEEVVFIEPMATEGSKGASLVG